MHMQLKDDGMVKKTIEVLVKTGFVGTKAYASKKFYYANSDMYIARMSAREHICRDIITCQEYCKCGVTAVTHDRFASSPPVPYNSLIVSAIDSARSTVFLTVLNQMPEESLVMALKRAGTKGVLVKILFASEKLMRKIDAGAQYHAYAWLDKLKECKHIELREFTNVDCLHIVSSVIIDQKALLLPIFSPQRDLATNATVLETEKEQEDLNLLSLVMKQFSEVWLGARKLGSSAIGAIFRSDLFLAITFIVILVFASIYLSPDSTLYSICINLIVAVLSWMASKYYPSIKNYLVRLRRRLDGF